MQLKLGVVFLFSLVLAQHNSSGVAFTRHDAMTAHRNSARQNQGVYEALKHPPLLWDICARRRSPVVPLHLKPIQVFPECSLNKQGRKNYVSYA